jgi:aminoglycoside/choline kinase family phosphotransferase
LFDVYGTDQESPALASAIAMLHALQSITDSGVPPYTTERFAAELDLSNEWFLDAFLGLERNKAAYEDVYASLIAQTQEQPQVCVHRDYHCRNLLFEEGELGVVDFQDALMGPALYDLASLLRDCYHVFAEPQIERWLRTYVADSTLDLDPVAAKRWLDLTAVQRQLKAIGIFARLHVRYGKPSHLPHIIPVLERVLDLARRHRETAALAPCLERVLPDAVHALAVT